jgi:hypothetical protein
VSLGWGASHLVDGQRYWFALAEPATLHWEVSTQTSADPHRRVSYDSGCRCSTRPFAHLSNWDWLAGFRAACKAFICLAHLSVASGSILGLFY